MLHTSKALQLTWSEVSKIMEAEIEKILGRRIICEAAADGNDCYWSVLFPNERLSLADLYRLLENIDANEDQRLDTVPPQDDHADSVNSIGMDVCKLLLHIHLGYEWQALHIDTEYLWILGESPVEEQVKNTIWIAEKHIDLSELKSKQDVVEYLFDNGPTHTTLMDMCEEYRQKYQNELCWKYPISDGKHLGTFMLLVKEGILSIPYDDADKVDYELFCMDDVCLFDLEAMDALISDWYYFDVDLRHAMADMKRYLQEKEKFR